MPTKVEENLMAIWLRSRRIAFEATNEYSVLFYDQIELKFIDYKNNCLLVSKLYEKPDNNKDLRALVKKFEQEEVYPILFEDTKNRTGELATSMFRLIRED